MLNISYSAPGKVILSGEHSVIYGKPAFVTAVDLRLTFAIHQEKTAKKHQAIDHIEQLVLSYLNKHKQIQKREFGYSIHSDIPVGRGMGSSAAFCVASVAALLHFYTGKQFDKQVVNSLAYQSEKFFHGMPSGVDVSASCFGGFIFYRKEFEFLKHISSLNFKMPANIQRNLLLIDSGKPVESTAEMVKTIGQKYNKHAKEMEQYFIDIEKVTKRMVIGITTENKDMFTEALSENETLIEQVGLVSEKTQKLMKELHRFGIGKVTGAGGTKEGSGMIICYAENVKDLKQYLQEKNIEYFPFKQDFEGVRLEK